MEDKSEVTVALIPLEKLDLSTTADFKKLLAPFVARSNRLVLNMDMVSFVDSSGLGAILSCLRDMNASGGNLKLCCLQKRVRVMFDLVRMQRILGIFDTPEEAVAAFAAEA